MDIQKNCKNCLNGKILSINGDIICRINGIVKEDFVCKKHKPIISYKFQLPTLKCIDCKNFIKENQEPENFIGLCKIFTVRKYDGRKKRACSKLEKLEITSKNENKINFETK